MIKEEVDLVLPLFGTENGRIDRKALTDWVVSPFPSLKKQVLIIVLISVLH